MTVYSDSSMAGGSVNNYSRPMEGDMQRNYSQKQYKLPVIQVNFEVQVTMSTMYLCGLVLVYE